MFVYFLDIQRRIELIQDFEMPTVCTSIKVSRDGQFILAAGKRLSTDRNQEWALYSIFFFFKCSFISGTYKPRIRCYDTYQLSLKFERCLDSDGKSVHTQTLAAWLSYHGQLNLDEFFFSPFLTVVAFDILSDDYSKVRLCLSILSLSTCMLMGWIKHQEYHSI